MKKILPCILAVTATAFSATLFANKNDAKANAASASATATASDTSNASSTSNAQDNVYDETKLNIMVNVKQPEFILKLKSNPTTGYSWFLREYDPNLIAPVRHSYQQPVKELIGSAGFETWMFRVKSAGFNVPQQTTIRMVYARPWQGNDNSTQLVFRISTQGR